MRILADDIATSLLHAEVDGQRLTDIEFNFFFMLLIKAGGDTTRNLVAGGMCVLMDHPEERAKLEADPSLLPTAVEEMLRYVSPVIAFVRTATKDTELRGVPVKKGDRVAMFYPSANRDEAHFADPDRFDLAVNPTRTWHLVAAAPISASARTWPGWRRPPSCPRCCPG